MLVLLQTFVLAGLLRVVVEHRDDAGADQSSHTNGHQVLGMPKFEAMDLTGKAIHSSVLAGDRTALLFISPECNSCAGVLNDIDAVRQKASGNLLIVCLGDAPDCQGLAERHAIVPPIIPDQKRKISRAFGISGVPTAMLFDDSGQLVSRGHPMGGTELADILAQEEVALGAR